MLKRSCSIFICLVLLYVPAALTQNKQIDSLKQVLRTAPQDTSTAKELINLGWKLRNSGQYDSGLLYTKKGQKLAAQLNFKKQVGKALTICGVLYMDKGEHDSSQTCHLASLKIRQEINDKKGIAACYNNLGNLYELRGNYPRALQMQLMGLKIREELKDKKEIAGSLNNIGNIYMGMNDYGQALKYFFRSIDVKKEIGDSLGIAMSYGNIGLIYEGRNEHQKALDAYTLTLAIEKRAGYMQGIADCYSNIGQVYYRQGTQQTDATERTRLLKEGLTNGELALRIREEIGEKQGLVTSLSNIGSIYFALGDYTKTEAYALKGLPIAIQLNALDLVANINRTLSDVYGATGRHKASLEHYKKHVAALDSLNNEANTKKTVQLEMQYEFDKKEAAGKLEQEKKEVLAAAEQKRQRIILLAISGFGLLVLGFALFAYRSLIQKKKANIRITRQKEIIEEKQKEILDSIYYARRIQRSLLTSERYIAKYLQKP